MWYKSFAKTRRSQGPDIESGVQSFSAIVGPNGSGKSNVIDAMLFVFGKRAKQVWCTKPTLVTWQQFPAENVAHRYMLSYQLKLFNRVQSCGHAEHVEQGESTVMAGSSN